jgi:hypothetical protein
MAAKKAGDYCCFGAASFRQRWQSDQQRRLCVRGAFTSSVALSIVCGFQLNVKNAIDDRQNIIMQIER